MVPNYLSSIADQIIFKKNTTIFHIKCACGCDSFLLAKSKQREVDKRNSFDNYWNSFKFPIFSLRDAVDKKNGEKYIYGTTFFGIRLGKFYYKDIPVYNKRRIVKAKCYSCGAEMTIFDSCLHGYNSLIESEEHLEITESAPQFCWTKDPKEIIVLVRNSLPYEEFIEEFDDNLEKYSNAFESIEIYTLQNGRKRKFFEEETA